MRKATWVVTGLIALLASFYSTRLIRPETPRIMIAGDSIVAGYTVKGWAEPFAFGFRGPLLAETVAVGCRVRFVGGSKEPWTGRAGTPRLAAVPDLRALGQDGHRGYGGEPISRLARGFPIWLILDNPDVVIINAGINDLSQTDARVPNSTKVGLRAMILATRIIQPRARILVAEIAPYATSTTSTQAFNSFVDAEIAGRHVQAVDLYSLFVGPDGKPMASAYSNAINHPTNATYSAMAGRWFTALRPILEERGACA